VKLADLDTELADGLLRPAYLLAGDEALLRDDAEISIRRATLGEGPADFDLDRLSGESATAAGLRDTVAALPVIAARRLVFLREPESRRASKALTDGLADLLPEVLGQQQTVLVVTAAKADRRSRWVKAFKQPAATVDCSAPRGSRALERFVLAEAARQAVGFDRGAAELLVERVGPQLLLLRQEIAKVALLAGPEQPVSRSHVDASTGQLADEPIWDLTDAIGEGRLEDSVGLLGRMLSSGTQAPVVLGSLASHFRKLLRVQGGGRVAGPPFVVQKLTHQARRYPPGRLEVCLGAIHGADTALKGAGVLGPNMALERLVLGLAR
jgi:DNA polymerase-3 subunit delta